MWDKIIEKRILVLHCKQFMNHVTFVTKTMIKIKTDIYIKLHVNTHDRFKPLKHVFPVCLGSSFSHNYHGHENLIYDN